MSPQFSLLQGEIKENPEIDSGDVENLLEAFLQALLEEQPSLKSAGKSSVLLESKAGSS